MAVQSPPPAPHPALTNNAEQSIATSLFVSAAITAVLLPGSILGALFAWAMWRATRPSILGAWLLGALGALTAATLWAGVDMVWPWRTLLYEIDPSRFSGIPSGVILRSVEVEALVGPLLIAALQTGLIHWGRTIQGQEWARYSEVAARKKALERHWPGPNGGPPSSSQPQTVDRPGSIALGVIAEDGHPFELTAEELSRHVFLPGISGSGKTTTIARLVDGALSNGYAVVIVDCKGSGLGGTARSLAKRHGVPFTTVDPKAPDSVGYDPCSGDAAAVANKIVGAFTFSGEAEIYKQVAMEAVPVICRAMQAAGKPVTLDSLYDTFNKGSMSRLGRADGAEQYRVRLEELESSGGVGAAGYAGLQRRLGALMEGTFGELFRREPALSWHDQLAEPQVTYLSLSATAASEDVELFGRVVTQDLKQVCDERMRGIEAGADPRPALIVYDEFAALREALQVVDLLLQARQARTPLVVSTQYLPEETSIRRPVLSAGVLIAHQLEAEDAELVASQFGTHETPLLTAQVDYETGGSEKGSVRWVEQFDVHPNVFKSLPRGMAAVLVRASPPRKAVVKVHLTD